MTEKIKNGKHHTIDNYSLNFIFFILSVILSTSLVSGSSQGKTWVIVIDPGHGGRDPGAIGSICREKDINLAIALKTGAYLEKNLSNVKVVYTRNSDKTVDLYERPIIANRNKADLFVSIHANKTGSKTVAGAETYVMGLAKDKESLDVAMKENEVMLLEKEDDDYSSKYQGFDPKSQESYIMFTVMMDVYHKQSISIASKLQTQFTERVSRKDRGVKQAGFWVLFNTAMPSVLVETGFLSNPEEEKFLVSETGQDYLASAIFRACRGYLEEINSRSVVTANLVKEDASDNKDNAPEEKKEIPEVTKTVIKNDAPKPDKNSDDSTREIMYEAGIVTKDTILYASANTPAPSADIELPSIFFMVQVASSVTPIPISPANFKGVNDISEIFSQKWYKYVSGKFTDYSEALKYKNKMREKFPQAFIIALKENQVIPLQEALNQKMK
jgi:N-acetylmuramoyl-L-alanine amidase